MSGQAKEVPTVDSLYPLIGQPKATLHGPLMSKVPTVVEITQEQIDALVEAAKSKLADRSNKRACDCEMAECQCSACQVDRIANPQTILALIADLKQARSERDAANAEAAKYAAALRVAVTYHANGLIALGATDGQPVMIDREQLIRRGIKRALEQAASAQDAQGDAAQGGGGE